MILELKSPDGESVVVKHVDEYRVLGEVGAVIYEKDMKRLMRNTYEVIQVDYKGKIVKLCRCEDLED